MHLLNEPEKANNYGEFCFFHVLEQICFKSATVHSGQGIMGGGDKTVQIGRHKWKFGIFLTILSEW